MNNSLAEVRPELVPEWSEKNLSLTPDDIAFGSNKKYGGSDMNLIVHRLRWLLISARASENGLMLPVAIAFILCNENWFRIIIKRCRNFFLHLFISVTPLDH